MLMLMLVIVLVLVLVIEWRIPASRSSDGLPTLIPKPPASWALQPQGKLSASPTETGSVQQLWSADPRFNGHNIGCVDAAVRVHVSAEIGGRNRLANSRLHESDVG